MIPNKLFMILVAALIRIVLAYVLAYHHFAAYAQTNRTVTLANGTVIRGHCPQPFEMMVCLNICFCVASDAPALAAHKDYCNWASVNIGINDYKKWCSDIK